MTEKLKSVNEWVIDNKLSLYLGKTESILFGSKLKLNRNSSLNISCNGTDISSTNLVKYLGALLESFLSCEEMVNTFVQKVNARHKVLFREQSFLTMHAKKLLISSLIQCHFDYACSFLFRGFNSKNKKQAQGTQNKLIKFVLNLEHRTPIDHILF